ncbi:MAG: O-antigen ligase family protein [Thermoguttaceae bacterium]
MNQRKTRPTRVVGPPATSHGDRLRPWLLGATTALFVARPLFPSESAALFGDGLTMVMLWIALAVVWLLGAIGRPTFRLRFSGTDVAVLLLIGWHTIAALWAVGGANPRPAWNMLWEWLGMALAYGMARQLVDTPREARAMVVVMIALAVALSGYGLYQYACEFPATRAEYAADPDQAMRRADFWFLPGSAERKLFEDRLQSTEPIATFALTNSLAGYLAPWLAVLACLWFAAKQNRRRQTVMFAVGAVVAACLLLTKSRSGYLAVGAGFVLAWWLCRDRVVRFGWKWPLAAAGSLALLVAAALAVGGLDRQVLGEASKSFGYRLQYWQSTARMIADHPVVGCGPGNFQDAYLQYKLPEASEEVADPHNFLMEIAATAGVPALVAFLIVLGCFFVGQVVHRSSRSGPVDDLSGSFGQVGNPSCVWIGAMVGFPLSVATGIFSAAPPGNAALWIGWPLAAVTVAMLWGWIQNGRMPYWTPTVGIVVLLVNLLAAGGIGLPSVAGTFWLLLALGQQGGSVRAVRVWVAWIGLIIALGIVAACYATAYRPVLNCQAEIQQAQREREPDRAVEHLQAAAAADPWSAEPWRRLAAVEFADWVRQPDPAPWQRFQKASDEYLHRASRSATAWRTVAAWRLEAFERTQRRECLESAIAAFRQAAAIYPNNAILWAQLAEADRTAGHRAEFRRAAETALTLDKATPHVDKKLPDPLRQRLQRGLVDVP